MKKRTYFGFSKNNKDCLSGIVTASDAQAAFAEFKRQSIEALGAKCILEKFEFVEELPETE